MVEALPETVLKPRYRQDELSAGIVHFGVGNFHRSHQAVYLDALFNLGLDQDWAIIGAGVRTADEEMRRKLAVQDYLTTVVEQEADRSQARVIGSMIDFLPVGDLDGILRTLADPAIRIVSLTVTEGGYYIDPASLRFDPDHLEIIADAANLDAPNTVFGLILAGLKLRRAAGAPPFTVLSCDNIPGNGRVTRNAVVGLAQLVDAELADWVDANVAFPNSMVDRITPATTDRERTALQRDFGIVDRCPVFCEEFKQWVIEDHFSAGRPALERVGVQFVDDVGPYELMKIRILNGGHATIAYAAGLLDIEFVHEAMADPLIRAFLAKVEREEIIPTVPPVPGTDLGDYYTLIERRFANPKIGDTIQRLCYDGANRQPKFILPTAADRVARGQSVAGLALVSALWARHCFGETESGAPISPNDTNWDRLSSLAKLARREPEAWLSMTEIFGELAADPTYVASFTDALSSLWSVGGRPTLERYLATER
ncbi:mannitol dehydrogenase family protein [Mesorhizobium sp. L-8-3]|uniref:mannitol dehydrogenase family protein n=1 Tax=Mesorhizobium sp. L-8-3 TaxID=2744522 RepID=UPI001936DEEB|nr:mannitol dehydrogenase family protein [Mesorhizobium sp. L-8-3]BCH27888.1 mannitol 2-dehydrogenase [Mesorhizobium sp. L-8-3]